MPSIAGTLTGGYLGYRQGKKKNMQEIEKVKNYDNNQLSDYMQRRGIKA